MPAPRPVRIFHITAIENLAGICAAGAILAKNSGAAAGIAYQNIAHQGAQGARAARAVPTPPGGVIHDFVPFYFAPRSPMLFAINRGAVAGCSWRQRDIVHIETTVELAVAGGRSFVFYDRNATLAYSIAYTNLDDLDSAVAWDLITEPPCLDGYCQYWQNRDVPVRYTDRMEKRQAEFLIRDRLPLGAVVRLGVMDSSAHAQVRGVLASAALNLRVDVMREWYF